MYVKSKRKKGVSQDRNQEKPDQNSLTRTQTKRSRRKRDEKSKTEALLKALQIFTIPLQ
tara:strand:- start:249 stop:425 length:177 start_codon:yes stop_codon:yes gene_type:complete